MESITLLKLSNKFTTSKLVFVWLMINCVYVQGQKPLKTTSTKIISNCKPPSKQFIMAEARRIIQTDPRKALIYPKAFANIKEEQVSILTGSFSGKNKQEYLVVIPGNNVPLFYYSIQVFDLLLKVSCNEKSPSQWTVDWYAQDKGITQESVIDVDGDNVHELVIKSSGAKRGILRQSCNIISLKNNQTKMMYKRYVASYGLTGLSIFNYLHHSDTLDFQYQLKYQDINHDGVNEIIEDTQTEVVNGGKTYQAILKNALKLKQTRILYLTKGQYHERNQDQMIRKAKQYYQFLNQGHYSQIKRLFTSDVQQWLGLKNISKEKVGREAARFLNTKKNVRYQPDFSSAKINLRTLSIPVELSWNQYSATVKAYFVFNKNFEIIRLVEQTQ